MIEPSGIQRLGEVGRARITNGADFVPLDAPMRLHLEWRGGAIDQSGSRILAPEPAQASALFDRAADLVEVGVEEE